LNAYVRTSDILLTDRGADRENTWQLGNDDFGRRLLTIPGGGSTSASVMTGEVGDCKQYIRSRDFAGSIGLVPRKFSE
jgi:transposase